MDIKSIARLEFFKRWKAKRNLKKLSEKTLRKIAADYTDPRQKRAQRLLKRDFPTSNDVNDFITGAMLGLSFQGIAIYGWDIIFNGMGFKNAFNLLVNLGLSAVGAKRFLKSVKAKKLNKKNPERIKYKNAW